MTQIPYISSEEIDGQLDWHQMTDALIAGHKLPKAEISDQFVTRRNDTLLSRAAWVDGMGIAVKSVTVFPARKTSVQGAMLIFDDITGGVEAIFESGLVTKWKTAADSLLGAKLLARPDAKRLLIVGLGNVARNLVDAYRAGFPEINIEVWGRDKQKSKAFAREKDVNAVFDLQKSVETADIISCATLSKDPVILGEWLQPGQHLDLIGAFKADMRETDDTALQCSKIFVDSRETTLDHIGEMKIPLASGAIKRSDVLADFYDLANGAKGRNSDADITLFKNGGGAHLDLMIGRAILATWKTRDQ